MARRAGATRDTNEARVRMTLGLDGTGQAEIHAGIGSFNHMLHGFVRRGLFDSQVSMEGDLKVDIHHTVEGAGIVLGKAIKETVGDKKDIVHYGSKILPTDEILILCALGSYGHLYLAYDSTLDRGEVDGSGAEMIREFFYTVSYGIGMSLHLRQLSGISNHHIIEAAFKASARSLDEATRYDEWTTNVSSTKESL